jgi:hypothetical protein
MVETKSISFHNGNINNEVLIYQKRVFDYLGIPYVQIKTSLSHDEVIEDYLLNFKPKNFILFDIDCIPLNYKAYLNAIEACDRGVLYGARQHASHIPNSKDYVAPCYMAFSFETYKQLGYPSTKITSQFDCAGKLTSAANEKNLKVEFVEVTNCRVPKWKFDNGSKFGNGTTYGDLVYHEFEINSNKNVDEFVNKCKSVML